MARDLAGRQAARPGPAGLRRVVAINQATLAPFGDPLAADALGQRGIVIAGDPDPVMRADQPVEQRQVARHQTGGPAAIVETVAKADHAPRPVMPAQPVECRQRRRRVVGRQQPAAGGKGRALFEMHVGDDKAARRRIDRRTGKIELKTGTGKGKGSSVHRATIADSPRVRHGAWRQRDGNHSGLPRRCAPRNDDSGRRRRLPLRRHCEPQATQSRDVGNAKSGDWATRRRLP